MAAATPVVVEALTAALGDLLNRDAYVRQVKNRNEWWVTDPLLSFVQHGSKVGISGYRAGFFVDADQDDLSFFMTHAPVIARLFRDNFSIDTLRDAVIATAMYRSRSHLIWSSRVGQRGRFPAAEIVETDPRTFVETLDEWDREVGLKRDLFPTLGRRKDGEGKPIRRGHDFRVLLAEPASHLSPQAIQSVVRDCWPLFRLMYPSSPIESRDASLARSLRSAHVPRACEVARIAGIAALPAATVACDGPIEGAHIKPHAKGGNDRVENGLWLCRLHHRATEGRLSGTRAEPRLAKRGKQ